MLPDEKMATTEQLKYYGICYLKSFSAVDLMETESLPPVVTDYEDVKAILKKCKTCRFRVFKTREEALTYATTPSVQATPLACNSPVAKKNNVEDVEKGSVFRVPKPQEMHQLRAAIEKGDTETFKQTVWSNPRYLIGTVDNPTIFKEGGRYNAMHVIAMANQPIMCRLLLETIENPKFIQLYYSDDKPQDWSTKIHKLVDFYLNMRVKGLFETPLHIASKFGYVEIVAILVAHPACDKDLKNNDEKTAKEIALTRCKSSSSELKEAMAKAFNDTFFVAVVADSDEAVPPYISEPMSPNRANQTLEEFVLGNRRSPLVGSPVVRALAGPMSQEEATQFHKLLKHPNCMLPQQSYLSIKLSDMDKGYERIGRCTAKEMNVGWKEKWPFGYCDVTSPTGLKMMDDYLKMNEFYHQPELETDDHSYEHLSNKNIVEKSISESPVSSLSSESPMTNLCISFKRFSLNSPEMDNVIVRLCTDLARQLARDLREKLESGDFKSQFIINLLPSLECLQRNLKMYQLTTVHQHIAKMIAEDFKNNIDCRRLTEVLPSLGQRIVSKETHKGVNEPSRHLNAEEHVRCIINYLMSQLDERSKDFNHISCSCDWTNGESEDVQSKSSGEDYYTPPSSLSSSRCSSPDEHFLSPSAGIAVFINGTCPSKLDLDVMRALGDTMIDHLLYPHVYRWKCLVSSFSKEQTESWRPLLTPSRTQNSARNGISQRLLSPVPIINLNQQEFGSPPMLKRLF